MAEQRSAHGQAYLIERFAGRAPTFTEFSAAQGRLTEDEMIRLRESDPKAFDPDVVGVFMGVWADKELGAERIALAQESGRVTAPALYFSLMLNAGINTLSAVAHLAKGESDRVIIDVALAGVCSAGAAYINHMSGGVNAFATKEWVRDHCPPIYSRAYVEDMIDVAMQEGIEVGTMLSGSVKADKQKEKRGPLYQSVDGKQTIDTIPDLLASLGEDPRNIATRVVLLLRRYERDGKLDDTQIETLRRSQALINVLEVPTDIFCDEGQRMIAEMNHIIAEFERSKET